MKPGGAVVLGSSYRALEVVRSLGRRGVPVWVVRTDDHMLAGRSRYAKRTLDWSGASEEERLARLLALDARGWALIPTGDEEAALLARNHEQLSEYFHVSVAPWRLLRAAYDKRELYAVAASAGLDQPRTAFPATSDEVAELEGPFPLIIKPAFKAELNALTSAKAWRVDDRAALARRWAEASELVDPAILMVQQLVGGDDQLSFAALCHEGDVVACLTARRARQWPRDFGQASTNVVTINDPQVERDARRLLAALKLTGIVEVEFKRHPETGKALLLDVNPRAWGWLSLGPRAGVDFAWLLWCTLSGERVPALRGRAGVRWVRLVTDLLAVAGELRSGRLTPLGYLRSLRRPLACAVLATDDPMPAIVNAPLLASVRAGRKRAR
jgi:predicted ATP-grasp superfamily ATP-dependent carboligase